MTLPRPYYDRDGITIYHGDCREILPLLKADVVVTDPPYGVEYRQPRACSGRMSFAGDDRWAFSRPSQPFVVWGANNSDGFSDCGWLVWDKERYGKDLFGDGELAATNTVRGVRIFTNRWNRNHGAGWTGSHPTEKPVDLMRWCLGFVPAGVVIDPFSGSGSTLLAAFYENRRAIGIEIEERYCEIAVQRLAQGVLPFGSPAPEAPDPASDGAHAGRVGTPTLRDDNGREPAGAPAAPARGRKTVTTTNNRRKPYIVCAGTTGRAVVFGWCDKAPQLGVPCTLHDARMVLYWSVECGGLFGLASHGPKTNTRITESVAATQCVPAQMLTVAQEAADALRAWDCV